MSFYALFFILHSFFNGTKEICESKGKPTVGTVM